MSWADGLAFGDCTGLTSITLPKSVTVLGAYAFYGCTELASVFQSAPPTLQPPCCEPAWDTLFWKSNRVVVYHLAAATGWGSTFGGRPTAIWVQPPSYSQWAATSGLVAKFPNASAEQDDPDQDGLTNIQEMTAGTDPTDPRSALVFEPAARLGDLSDEDKTTLGSGEFAIYFQCIPGTTYEILSTEALGSSWTTAVSVTATTTQKRVRLSRPAVQRFYRVVIQ